MAILDICSSSWMIRFSWLLTSSLRDLSSFKISSRMASDFCRRNKSLHDTTHFWSQCCYNQPVKLTNTARVIMINPTYVTTTERHVWTIYGRWQDLVHWGLICFSSTTAQCGCDYRAELQIHMGWVTAGYLLWVRCGGMPSNSHTGQQWWGSRAVHL